MTGTALLSPTAAPPRAPTPRRIELPGYELADAIRLERELGVSRLLAQILVRRGFGEPAAARAFLAADERHDPGCFEGLEVAIDLVHRHLRAGSRIVVHGDYDVDGVCATAIMVRALTALGADVSWYLPSRHEDGYGLAAPTVRRLADAGTGLLITVDCGITAVEEVELARAGGLDVLVSDHHAPRGDGELPRCPIVHPRVCGYPTTELCGSAVAHKLAQALQAPTVVQDVELVALATVADVVPLVGENRRLVREGLEQMAGTPRPGLRALMQVSRTDPSALDASCLGFRLAPRINAAGRMGRADGALELLLTSDPQRAETIATELDVVNARRRGTEERITWEAEALAARMGERAAYVLAAPGWHAGVIGIVASKLVEHHHRPTIMLALDREDPQAPAHGSGRSIPGFDLLAALEATGAHLISYGGHRAAAGLTIDPERIEDFAQAFERHAQELLTPELLESVERVDAVASAAEMTLELADELGRLGPFGNGNPAPRLYVPGARFEAVRRMGEHGQHRRFDVVCGAARASAVAFGCEGPLAGADGGFVDASFRLERNAWRGVLEPRLILGQALPCEPQAVTVLGQPDDYLAAALGELDRILDCEPPAAAAGEQRQTVDGRGRPVLATLADLQAVAGPERPLLVVCAETSRRLQGFAGRRGGFVLVSHASLAEDPALAADFQHVVVIDPPACAAQDAATLAGRGYRHLAWGEAELRFTRQMHEFEYDLRTSLVALYRALRDRNRVTGGELELLLRGDGTHPRTASLAGRLLRVLAELGLVSLDRELPALELAEAQPTALERSAAYRAYTKINEDGQRFLNRLQAASAA
jgi:single-stranded-DNA-specific exonuclease